MVRHNPRSRNWLFTSFKSPTETVDELCSRIQATYFTDQCQYCIYQIEKCPETHRVHAQGYLQLLNAKSLQALKKAFSAEDHFEKRLGSHKEAKAYCSKNDSRLREPQEHGQGKDDQGVRVDLADVRDLILQGANARTVLDSCFGAFVKYHTGIEKAIRLMTPSRTEHTFLQIIWGESGSGKSFYAAATSPASIYWLSRPNGSRVWWDGYEGQETVVIDEFKGWLPHGFLCCLADRNPCMVETKGGSTQFRSRRLILLSNQEPTTWYRHGLGALRRRMQAPLGSCHRLDKKDNFVLQDYEPLPDPEPNYF